MPKLVHRTPKYRRHRASGQAIVTINGHDIYLGPYGTAVSPREYDRVIGEWLANGRQSPVDGGRPVGRRTDRGLLAPRPALLRPPGDRWRLKWRAILPPAGAGGVEAPLRRHVCHGLRPSGATLGGSRQSTTAVFETFNTPSMLSDSSAAMRAPS